MPNRTGKSEHRKATVDERGRRKDAARRARLLAEKNADAMPAVAAYDGPRHERQVQAPLVDPAPKGGLLEILSMRYLLRLIVSRELAKMYAASLLGLLWSYIQPAMRFATYYFVFGVVLHRHTAGMPNFAIHLFCGMVFVHYFTETWSSGTRSIWGNKQLVLKMRVPREIFPVASMIVAMYHTLPQLILLMLICLIIGWHVGVTGFLAGLLGLALLTTFAMSLSLVFAALNVFFKDFQNIVATVAQFLHFMVPMMYPYSLIEGLRASHPIIYQIYMANPLAEAVLLMQKFFWQPLADNPDSLAKEFPADLWERGLIMLVVCVGLLFLAQRFFSRLEGKFPERL